jgi:hypothetical protein
MKRSLQWYKAYKKSECQVGVVTELTHGVMRRSAHRYVISTSWSASRGFIEDEV